MGSIAIVYECGTVLSVCFVDCSLRSSMCSMKGCAVDIHNMFRGLSSRSSVESAYLHGGITLCRIKKDVQGAGEVRDATAKTGFCWRQDPKKHYLLPSVSSCQ